MCNARRRHGIALFAAVGIMTIVALLVAGAVASARLAQHSWSLEHADLLLDTEADRALGSVLSDARDRGLDSLPLDVATNALHSVDGAAVTDVSATRLPNGLLWLVADARLQPDGAGHRRFNLIARWRVPSFRTVAGVVSRGDVRATPVTSFSRDTTGDADCRATGDAPDVALADGARATGVGAGRVEAVPTANDS